MEVTMKTLRCIFSCIIVLLLFNSCKDQKIISELESLKSQIQLEEKNKEVVKRWLSELDKENFEIVDELVAENCIAYYSRDTVGREWLRNSCEAFPQSFKNSRHIIKDLVAENDKVIARLTVKAIPIAEFMGYSSNGEPVEYDAYTLYRIENGKIKEIWVDHNAVYGLLVQLGMKIEQKE